MLSSSPRAWHFSATRRTGQPAKSGIESRGALLISMIPESSCPDGQLGCSSTCPKNEDAYDTGRIAGSGEVAASALSESGGGDPAGLPRTWRGKRTDADEATRV